MGIEAIGEMQWFLELLEELDIECRMGAPGEDSRERNAKQKRDRRDNKLSTTRPNVRFGEVSHLMVTGLTDSRAGYSSSIPGRCCPHNVTGSSPRGVRLTLRPMTHRESHDAP